MPLVSIWKKICWHLPPPNSMLTTEIVCKKSSTNKQTIKCKVILKFQPESGVWTKNYTAVRTLCIVNKTHRLNQEKLKFYVFLFRNETKSVALESDKSTGTNLVIVDGNGVSFNLEADTKSSFASLKQSIEEFSKQAQHTQVLHYAGQILQDDVQLRNYGIKDYGTIYMESTQKIIG